MASSSKKLAPETEEEMQARRRVIKSGITFGGHRDQYAGREIMMNRDGSNGFSFGPVATDPSSKFKWNEKTGDYRSHGGGILNIGNVAPAQAEGGGGGGQAPVVQAISEGYVDYGNPGNTYVAGGSGIVNRKPMDDWRPTARNSNGGGSYNPLVNPVNWMHNPDPLQVRNVGTYIQPNKKSYNGGLL